MNCFSLDIFKFISLLLSFNSLNRMYLMWLCIFLRVEFLRCVGFFNQFEKFSAIMSLNNLLQLHICWYFCYSTSFWDGSFFLIHSSVLQIVSFLWVFFWVHWFFFFFSCCLESAVKSLWCIFHLSSCAFQLQNLRWFFF